jgi:urease accessory protein
MNRTATEITLIIMTTRTIMAEPKPHLPAVTGEAAVTGTTARSADALVPEALRKLLAWLSPSFPVGGFSYSHGLEWAIEDGTVGTAANLEAWIADILRHGAGWSDAILFCHAHRAASVGDAATLREAGVLALAFQPSKERHLEATAQGRAFLSTVAATWPNPELARLGEIFPDGTPVTYPVAVALACAAHEITLPPALNAYLGAFTANLVSAAVRAIPLGQTDGQRIIAHLSPHLEKIVALAIEAGLEDLGGAALRADIASMKHETQYTRLFRS